MKLFWQWFVCFVAGKFLEWSVRLYFHVGERELANELSRVTLRAAVHDYMQDRVPR